MIDKGVCTIINPYDKYEVKNIYKGDFFGENEILKINGYHSFGDIIAAKDVSCWFIDKENLHRIPYYELYILKYHLSNRGELRQLNYTCTQRYGVDIDTVKDY